MGLIGFSGDQALYAGQAAGLAGFSAYSQYFAPVSRGFTNFLVFQLIVAAAYYIFGVSDILARTIALLFGIGTVLLIFRIGLVLFDRATAALSSIALAVSGYHVVISRMALMDSTATFFFFASLLLLTRWLKFSKSRDLYVSLVFAAISTLTKITAVLIFPIIAISLALRPSYRITRAKLSGAVIYLLPLAVLAASYLMVNSGTTTVGIEFQFSRASTHPIGDGAFALPKYDYYLTQILAYQGYVFLALVVLAGLYAVWKGTFGDHLVLATVLLPLTFFELYPLKGFQFVLPSIVAMSLLVGRLFASLLWKLDSEIGWRRLQRLRPKRIVQVGAGIVFVVMIATLTIQAATVIEYNGFYTGARELAYWLRDNTPSDAKFVTSISGLANIVQYYSLKPAYPVLYLGQVNPDPNVNIDQLVGNGTVRYVILDDFSTSLLKPFATHALDVRLKLAEYISNEHGELIYIHYVTYKDPNLGDVTAPRAWVYKLSL